MQDFHAASQCQSWGLRGVLCQGQEVEVPGRALNEKICFLPSGSWERKEISHARTRVRNSQTTASDWGFQASACLRSTSRFVKTQTARPSLQNFQFSGSRIGPETRPF